MYIWYTLVIVVSLFFVDTRIWTWNSISTLLGMESGICERTSFNRLYTASIHKYTFFAIWHVIGYFATVLPAIKLDFKIC